MLYTQFMTVTVNTLIRDIKKTFVQISAGQPEVHVLQRGGAAQEPGEDDPRGLDGRHHGALQVITGTGLPHSI